MKPSEVCRMGKMMGRGLGRCIKCLKKLLLNPENGMCINCEHDALLEKVDSLEACLAQARREKKQVYDLLITERKKTARNLA